MENRRLKVIIVGSGLSGLTAACILKVHHDVKVYERGNKDVATGGQGIIMAANGAKILESIGFDTNRAGSVEVTGLTMYNKQSNVLEDFDFDLKAKFGANYMSQKRSDFRDELLRIATSEPHPAKIEFNKNVIGLNPEESIELDNGSIITADLLIVADGVHSRLRKFIVGEGHTARKTGLTCYRIVASLRDAKEVLGEAGLPGWMNKRAIALISGADGTARIITVYPICGGQYFNMSCVVKTDSTTKPLENSWHANANVNEMMSHFNDFDSATVQILSTAREVKIWELQDLEPLPNWVKGKAILIGDAAHAMTPMQGQGANMAIEDAEAFRLLDHGDNVEQVLETIQNVRRARVLEVLAETRKSHSTLGVAERVIKNLEFNCGYNGILEAVKQEEKRLA